MYTLHLIEFVFLKSLCLQLYSCVRLNLLTTFQVRPILEVVVVRYTFCYWDLVSLNILRFIWHRMKFKFLNQLFKHMSFAVLIFLCSLSAILSCNHYSLRMLWYFFHLWEICMLVVQVENLKLKIKFANFPVDMPKMMGFAIVERLNGF